MRLIRTYCVFAVPGIKINGTGESITFIDFDSRIELLMQIALVLRASRQFGIPEFLIQIGEHLICRLFGVIDHRAVCRKTAEELGFGVGDIEDIFINLGRRAVYHDAACGEPDRQHHADGDQRQFSAQRAAIPPLFQIITSFLLSLPQGRSPVRGRGTASAVEGANKLQQTIQSALRLPAPLRGESVIILADTPVHTPCGYAALPCPACGAGRRHGGRPCARHPQNPRPTPV